MRAANQGLCRKKLTSEFPAEARSYKGSIKNLTNIAGWRRRRRRRRGWGGAVTAAAVKVVAAQGVFDKKAGESVLILDDTRTADGIAYVGQRVAHVFFKTLACHRGSCHSLFIFRQHALVALDTGSNRVEADVKFCDLGIAGIL